MGKKFDTVAAAIEDIRQGKMVILVDDEDRENEGDLCCAAEMASPEMINFMAKYGRGLICLALTEKQVDRLGLPMMTARNTSVYGTNFTVSIEAAEGVTTGISAADRSHTVLTAIREDVQPEDISVPGHIFPLRAKRGGVLRRAGQTEGSVDLARLAGLNPSGVICEIMNDDGTMARYDDLRKFADLHQLKIITTEDLIKYRLNREVMVKRSAEARLPTHIAGDFRIVGFTNKLNDEEYVALIKGEWEPDEAVLVRVHSKCLTGDVFGSTRCDCGEQLHSAMKMIEEAGKGVILYLDQEGRGIGIINKIKAYNLQDQGADTVEANEKLGFKPDLRDYGFGAQVLMQLGLKKIKLITNNPHKIIGLKAYGLDVEERVPLQMETHEENEEYLKTKKNKMGHILEFHGHP
ncbi:MAG: bifunctional 3,4-dihydroxy-2-butanone-4-phosphate synthase/GTP cyclohydrolase II [SAR324 cluster bacterium]|uniref:Riboflavin biosynthesis protein RibBA n=1 Tax=SAR324 cluster bacterium TaxID=2024889 RepID=A0A2A4TBE1_9DELT|nr:MAG: bifunctional 3,4-dihydroxy-2-butanone-4-phosphate synthase/GTP cyclohydrolase II [SAR324 cluster bacterium]